MLLFLIGLTAFLFYVVPVIFSAIICYVEFKEEHERGKDITFFEILLATAISLLPILNMSWVLDNKHVLNRVINLDFTVIKGKKND